MSLVTLSGMQSLRAGSAPAVAAATSSLTVARRCFHASRSARAGASDAHAHEHAAGEENYTPTGFSAPIWRNTVLLILAGAGIYRVTSVDAHPSPATSSGRPASQLDEDSDDEDKRPYLTRYIAQFTKEPEFWKSRNQKHLDLVREKAEDKLFFQDAERPAVHRFRYTGRFEQASPHKVELGTQTDLSNLQIKRE